MFAAVVVFFDVTITPATQFLLDIANGTKGVATISLYNQTGMPSLTNTHAESSANLKLKKC